MVLYICQLSIQIQDIIRNRLEYLGLATEEIDYCMTCKIDDIEELINIKEILKQSK